MGVANILNAPIPKNKEVKMKNNKMQVEFAKSLILRAYKPKKPKKPLDLKLKNNCCIGGLFHIEFTSENQYFVVNTRWVTYKGVDKLTWAVQRQINNRAYYYFFDYETLEKL